MSLIAGSAETANKAPTAGAQSQRTGNNDSLAKRFTNRATRMPRFDRSGKRFEGDSTTYQADSPDLAIHVPPQLGHVPLGRSRVLEEPVPHIMRPTHRRSTCPAFLKNLSPSTLVALMPVPLP